MAACPGWQSSYKDGRARVIFGNTARGGGHESWLESFRLDIWEDCPVGRELQLWDLCPWRLATFSYKATAALSCYWCQPCSKQEVGPTKGSSHQ